MNKRILHIAAFIVVSLATAFAQDITVFNFDGITPTFGTWGGETIVPIVNPSQDAINSSANVGLYTHVMKYSGQMAIVDIDPRIYTSYEVMVYIPFSTSGKIAVTCNDAAGKQLDQFETAALIPGVWTKITHQITFTKKIGKVEVSYDRNVDPSTIANENIAYVDNLVFKKSTSSDITIYNETFFASWSQYVDWTGLPSTQAGNWFGGVDLQTTSDAPMTIYKWNGKLNANDNNLILTPNAAAVTFPNINVTGFNSLKLSVDYGWVWSVAENTSFWDAAVNKSPKIEVKSGTGDWITIATKALVQDWAFNNVFVLLDALAAPLAGPTVSVRISSLPSLTMNLDNVKIIGVSTTTTSTNTVNKSNVTIYPNPTNDFISVKGAQSVTIFNLEGREVLSSQNVENIDVRKLNKGAYIVKAKTGGETINSKLIKN